ncbi:MAG: DNA mismatch repair endonuclease MutL [Sphingobacteriales bacterium]|nr:MAG: DNA mismatch repair endonuclease MutL [Sphingobacteriales bacterium]
MADVIRLLSDHLANQIAAGEVVQRPASAVKELLENAIDAGAQNIQLILKDAGKELIQVVDDGSGMSMTDARMAFERHATSKIRTIEDLFRIRTMGFRGEALASLAAVAQVELKTRREEDTNGTRLLVEATEVKTQEPCATPVGSSLAVKNLFYNVPARRHFLKATSTEMRHVVEEFTRVAMAYPEISFRLYHNSVEQFRLEKGSSKARIVDLLGAGSAKNLVPVEEDLDFLKIRGFIGKPEVSARTRGNQFFFVNGRFVRSPFLNHAVTTAYGALLPKEVFPFYVLFLDIDPKRVDVNVHPTKQEVKFEDEKLLYQYLQATVKHALAKFNITPSLDFTEEANDPTALDAFTAPLTDERIATIQQSPLAQSFAINHREEKPSRASIGATMQYWKDHFEEASTLPSEVEVPTPTPLIPEAALPSLPVSGSRSAFQVQGLYLITNVKSGVLIIHIRRAQERLLFERLARTFSSGGVASQQLLFPIAMEFTAADVPLVQEAIPGLAQLGFEINALGPRSFSIQGVPVHLPSGEERMVIEDVLEELKNASTGTGITRTERLLTTVARRLAHSVPTPRQPEELQALIEELFACPQPEFTPGGKVISRILDQNDLEGLFG